MKTAFAALALATWIGAASPALGGEVVREVYSPLGLPAAGYVYEPETIYYTVPTPTYYEGAYEYAGAYEYSAWGLTYYPPAYDPAYAPQVERVYAEPIPEATYYAPSHSTVYRTYYAPAEVYYTRPYVAPDAYYAPAVPAYVPGQPVRNFFRALLR